MCDLLLNEHEVTIKVLSISPSGAGYLFEGDIVESFCELNKVNFITRAYQLVMEGYNMFGKN